VARKSGNRGAHFDVWPVIADAFLAFLAVVVFMASGRPPLDFEVERLKAQLLEKAKAKVSALIDTPGRPFILLKDMQKRHAARAIQEGIQAYDFQLLVDTFTNESVIATLRSVLQAIS